MRDTAIHGIFQHIRIKKFSRIISCDGSCLHMRKRGKKDFFPWVHATYSLKRYNMHRPEPIASSLKSGLDLCEIAGFGERTGGGNGQAGESKFLHSFFLHIFAGKRI